MLKMLTFLAFFLALDKVEILAQGEEPNSRVINDSMITLNFIDKKYFIKFQLNRKNKTIVETYCNKSDQNTWKMIFNEYHTPIGKSWWYDSSGNVCFMADIDEGKAYIRDNKTGRFVTMRKPLWLEGLDTLLEKRYGYEFVKDHLIYFPNMYYHYDSDTFQINGNLKCPPDGNRKQAIPFHFKFSNGKFNEYHRFCIPFYLGKDCKEEIITNCKNNIDYNKFVFCDTLEYYYNKAKALGLSKDMDYITMSFSNASCDGDEPYYECSGSMVFNLIEIIKIDTASKTYPITYNLYKFNPWTREFLGKEIKTDDIYKFLHFVIDFDSEIYIHRFKDPLIPRKKYLDDIIKLLYFHEYKYILDP